MHVCVCTYLHACLINLKLSLVRLNAFTNTCIFVCVQTNTKLGSHLNTLIAKAFASLLQVKPLKELIFNSHDITATMTSRQFQVMLDVLTNLLFARLPK